MVMETVEQIITNLGTSDIDYRLEERLIDGMIYAFQEQTSEDNVSMLNGTSVTVCLFVCCFVFFSLRVISVVFVWYSFAHIFWCAGFGTVINALGARVRPYLPQIAAIIKWRLNNKARSPTPPLLPAVQSNLTLLSHL